MEKRVLVVDDEFAIVDAVTTMLRFEEIESAGASDCEGAVALMSGVFFPVIITDLCLHSREEGLRLIDAVREQAPRSRVIVLTGYATPAMEDELLGRGVAVVLQKPALSSVIIDAVNALLDELEREAGDGEVSLEELYLTLNRKLQAIPRKRFGLSEQAAEDVIQDAWVLFLRKRGLIRDAAPWLSGTVANLCRQQLDRRVRRRETSDDAAIAALAGNHGSLTDAIAVRQALARTEDRGRMLCTLIGMDGLSYEEVSTVTGIPLGSVGPLYIRAKKKIRTILEH